MLTFGILLASLLTLVYLLIMAFVGNFSYGKTVAYTGFAWYGVVLVAMFTIELTKTNK